MTHVNTLIDEQSQEYFEERAAILEFEAGLSHSLAEAQAYAEMIGGCAPAQVRHYYQKCRD